MKSFCSTRRATGFLAVVALVSALTIAPRTHAAEWALSGDLLAHDPTIIRQTNRWSVFHTGKGLQTKSSDDGLVWKTGTPIFAAELPWWRTYAPNMGANDVWAPDVHELGGRTWCYYCVSEFGKNNSAIGLLSCSSIAAGDWKDEGVVLSSKSGIDTFNALDPSLAIDADGKPWLVFGSFFDGLHVVQLDPATMKPTGTLYSIAKRDGGIEAPNIVYHNGYYYLFVSIDRCCVGVNSTYKIAVGRSKSITGPYIDHSGTPMLSGGGTVLEAGGTRWKGPGGQSVYNTPAGWLIVRHAYDADNNGSPALRIADLYWDAGGWPTYTASGAPTITAQPRSITLATGSAITLRVAANGDDLSYQWLKDDSPISGATAPTLTLSPLQNADAGSYTVIVSNGAGNVTSSPAVVTVASPKPGKIVNLSVRTQAGSGDQTLIVGFIVTGSGTKPILIRSTGPTLQNFGVASVLPDPALSLFQQQTAIARNDDWKTSSHAAEIEAVGGNKLGQYTISDKESVLLESLAANDYSAHVDSSGSAPGIALVEIDDEDLAQPGTPEFDSAPRLVNVSARAQVGNGDNVLIAGFIINGNVPKKLMVRGIGPTLAHFGVGDPLHDPQLTLFDQASLEIASNDDWGNAPNPDELLAANAGTLGDVALDPRESVLVVTLPPGAYSAEVSGTNHSTGVGLVEVFEL